MRIIGTDGMEIGEVLSEIEAGGRLIVFEYCMSYVVVTYHAQSEEVYFVRPGRSAFWRGVPYSLVTLLLGWWSIRGLVSTILVLMRNLAGGLDVTKDAQSMVPYLMRQERKGKSAPNEPKTDQKGKVD